MSRRGGAYGDNLPEGISPPSSSEENLVEDDARSTTTKKTGVAATLARIFPAKPPTGSALTESYAAASDDDYGDGDEVQNSAGVGALGHHRSASADTAGTVRTGKSKLSIGRRGTGLAPSMREVPPRALQPGASQRPPSLDAATLAPTIRPPPSLLPLPYNKPPRSATGEGKTQRRLRYSMTTHGSAQSPSAAV